MLDRSSVWICWWVGFDLKLWVPLHAAANWHARCVIQPLWSSGCEWFWRLFKLCNYPDCVTILRHHAESIPVLVILIYVTTSWSTLRYDGKMNSTHWCFAPASCPPQTFDDHIPRSEECNYHVVPIILSLHVKQWSLYYSALIFDVDLIKSLPGSHRVS